MRWRVLAIIPIVALFAQAVVASPQSDADLCGGGGTNASTLAACDRAIASGVFKGGKLAELYVARALMHSDKSRAIADYSRAIELQPDALTYRFRGDVYRENGEPDRAIDDYTRAIRLRRADSLENEEPFEGRAKAYESKGQLDLAIADYSEVLRMLLDKNAAAGSRLLAVSRYVDRAKLYLRTNQYDRAIADASEVIRYDPNAGAAIDAFNLRCLARAAKGDLDGALADCSEAIRQAPGYVESYANRASVYQKKGDLDHANADYDEMVRRQPGDINGYDKRLQFHLANRDVAHAIADYNSRAGFYESKGQPDRAIADYGEALRLAHGGTQAVVSDYKDLAVTTFLARGNIYGRMGQYDRAIEDLSEVIKLEPNGARTVTALNYRCVSYILKRDYDRAIADCDEAIRLDPKALAVYSSRASAYQMKGDFEHAIADASEMIRLSPGTPDGYVVRARIYQAKRDFAHAIADYSEIMRVAPNFAGPLAALRGLAYFQDGQYDRAIADLDTALRVSSANAEALYVRGLARQKKGDAAGGEADIAAARKLKADIAEQLASVLRP